MKDSKIAWTDHTFNPWWGCVKVSEGCANCYAATFAKRTGQDVWGADKPRRFFGAKHWTEPRLWNLEAQTALARRRVFCASMADVFEKRPDLGNPRAHLFELIAGTPFLDWLILTKRPENIFSLGTDAVGEVFDNWLTRNKNVWLGTTIENVKRINRIAFLKQSLSSVRFISAEPLLEDLGQLDLRGIDWVIVGGESGPGCRPFNPDWARSIRDQCQAQGAKFFMKQLGGVSNHRDQIEDFPPDLRIREYPQVMP